MDMKKKVFFPLTSLLRGIELFDQIEPTIMS